MISATYKDVHRLFPGIDDHAVVDLLAAHPSVAELEAALQMLQQNEETLIEMKRQSGDRLNRLHAILSKAQILAEDDR